MEKELLLRIQVTKSNLAKALMTRRKDQIEKVSIAGVHFFVLATVSPPLPQDN